jgi:hypothetical protein
MLRVVSSNRIVHETRTPTLGSVSPHVFPPCPSKLVRWVEPKQIPVPDMARLGRSFPQPGESPESVEGDEGLPLEVESTFIPSSYFTLVFLVVHMSLTSPNSARHPCICIGDHPI